MRNLLTPVALLSLVPLLGFLACSSPPPTIEPAPDVATAPAPLGDYWNDPWGWCTQNAFEPCTPNGIDVMNMCAQRWGDWYTMPLECWHADPPAAWGCLPLLWGREQCHVPIVCPGAEELPSIAWCCPEGDPPPPPPPRP